MDFAKQWSVLKDVSMSMWQDQSLIRAIVGGLGVAGLMELVRELGLGYVQEDMVQMSVQLIASELIRRLSSRSDPQHLAMTKNNGLGFRPLY